MKNLSNGIWLRLAPDTDPTAADEKQASRESAMDAIADRVVGKVMQQLEEKLNATPEQPEEPETAEKTYSEAEVEQMVEKAIHKHTGGVDRRAAAPMINKYGIGDDQFSFARVFKYLATRDERVLRPIEKANNEGTDSAGGYLVPTEQSNELIELVKAQAILAQSGARTTNMVRDVKTMPRVTGGATTSYPGEATAGSESQLTFGQLTLTAKKAITLVPVSSELLEDSDPDAESIIRDDMVSSMALKEDDAFFFGASGGPSGIFNDANINSYTLDGDVGDGATPTYDDLVKMKSVLMQQARVTGNPAWYFHPRFLETLALIKGTDGRPIWAPDPATREYPQTILGHPFYMSTQFSITQVKGSSTDCTTIGFGVPSEALIGRRSSITLMMSEHKYFSEDMVLFKARSRHDAALRTPAQWVKALGVRG